MYATRPAEARLDDTGHVLVAPPRAREEDAAVGDFFGTVVTPEQLAAGAVDLSGRTVHLHADAAATDPALLRAAARVLADPGRAPRRVGGPGGPKGPDGPGGPGGTGGSEGSGGALGVYYRRFFDPGEDHFGRISTEHAFQSLTESTKPGTAHRSGIYLTPVTADGAELHFRLLRCSTNLSGPTEGFRATDTRIVDALNREAATVLRGHAPLNHVLAQIYHNTPATAGRKQSKARISAHADKTKDMPANGLMAFCTFYDHRLDALPPLPADPDDRGLNGVSALTRLHFRRKEQPQQPEHPVEPAAAALPARFTVTLHPGSVLFLPLSTNRLYTHEIRPPALDAALLPTRLGYVVRCSDAEAVHRDGRTYLKTADGPVELGPPTEAGTEELRRRYAEENRSTSFVDYGARFPFSMNEGDYLAPRP
ncbi:hypothetical protein [Kitasatospora phosalacinea]|uniref:Fe2OG dioxygenase domain-containing protein n=1 Tax=Kitasatospora phosalacinea TaxID=2065 RepID=A0ABW6GKM7_9ACTN